MKKSVLLCFLAFTSLFANIEDYKIATWNLQGSSANTESKWNISVRQLVSGNNGADILAIQEAGSLPSTTRSTGRIARLSDTIAMEEFTWDLGTRSRPNSVFVYYSAVDTGANRVNLAIVSRQRADEIIILPPPTTVSRPIIGIRIGNDAFFSIHALANGGTDAPAIVNAVFAHFQNEPQVNWIIAGDFNRSPESLRIDLRLEIAVRASIVAPNLPTQRSGGTLDYAVFGNSRGALSPNLLTALLMLANFRTQLVSDHFPVNFRRFQ